MKENDPPERSKEINYCMNLNFCYGTFSTFLLEKVAHTCKAFYASAMFLCKTETYFETYMEINYHIIYEMAYPYLR